MSDDIHELYFYTLSHQGKEFIHQHAVDVHTAQTASEKTKPMAICFALGGLYLYLERGYTGREVQLWHMDLSKHKNIVHWPEVKYPENRGKVFVKDVLETGAGTARDNMIKDWCRSVWEAYRDSHASVISFVESSLDTIA